MSTSGSLLLQAEGVRGKIWGLESWKMGGSAGSVAVGVQQGSVQQVWAETGE